MSDRTEELLEELVAWTRFIARPQLENALRAILKDDRHQVAYELTDGLRTQTDIAKLAGIDQTTVSDLWARWRKAGIVRTRDRKAERLASLSDLGWAVQGVKAKQT